MSNWNPEAAGALCAKCYLRNRREGNPVPSEFNEGATVAIVAEAPGKTECQFGRPLIGESGQELQRAISAMGYRRADFHYLNAISCRPPGNELARLINNLKNENKDRKKKYGKEGMLPSPVQCCRPRLLKELASVSNVITLGGTPVQAITGTEHSVMAIRGGPIDGWLSPTEFAVDELATDKTFHPIRILPTVHPSFVLRQRKWTKTFRTDIGRAMRMFTGRLGWVEPEVVIRPTVEQIERFLFRTNPQTWGRWFSWDVETTREISPLIAKLFCIGIAYRDAQGQRHAIVIPFHSKERPISEGWGNPIFYSTGEFNLIVEMLKRWFVDPRWFKHGHNADIYDRTVIEATFGVTPRPRHDTLVLHRATESELPHGLGFVGTTLTDVTAWKAENSGVEAKTDHELAVYNGYDVVVTDDIAEPLIEAVKLRDQVQVVKKDYKFLEACVGMHRLGMKVDPKRRDYYDAYFLGEVMKWRKICRDVAGVDSFNPGSVDQVKAILFDRWGLPPVAISETTGEPSTDDDTLRAYRIQYNLTRPQLQFVEALRRYRNAVKMRGTDIVKYRKQDEPLPPDELWDDVEEDEKERAWRKKKDLKKRGILLADGRVHAAWNQLTTSGRGNCSAPNMQNKRRKYRDMYIPEEWCPYCKEPHVFVAADMDQLELRFGANRWNLSRYLEVFAEGRDPHQETAFAVFGEAAVAVFNAAKIWAAMEPGRKTKDHPDWKRMRDFAKRFYYACQYMAEDATVYDVITSVEDDDGNLIYADVSMSDTRERRANLLSANPEFETGWQWEIETWRKQGFLQEPVWGRRRDFLNGEEPNEIVNFPIQAGGRSVVLNALFSALEAIPFEKWCPKTGLVHDGHDSEMFEVPLSKGEWAKNVLQECMTQKVPGHSVMYTAEGKVGVNKDPGKGPVGRRSWADV